MKRSITLIILLSFNFLLTSPLMAQRSNRSAQSGFLKIPLRYSNAEAFSDGNGVWLQWETSSETGNLGFHIYRVVGDQKELVSPDIIPGLYLKTRNPQTTGGNYSFFDTNGDFNSVYYIESFNLDGQKQKSDPVVPKYIKDLTAIAGSSSEFLREESNKANPVVQRSENILPKDLQAEVEANSPQADITTQQRIAAQPGVKIGVKKSGFYRVTRAELEAGGFNVNSPSELWQLYLNGVQQSIIVGNNGDYIEFYGNGIDTADTNIQNYFLTVGAENGKRIGGSFLRPMGGRVVANSFQQTTFYKERTTYATNIFNGDTENFFGRVITGTPTTISLNLPAVDANAATFSFDLTLMGITTAAHQTKVLINNVEAGIVTANGIVSKTQHFELPVSVLNSGANNLTLQSLGGSSDVSFFDIVKINYSNLYKAQQNQLSFFTSNYKAANVSGFSSANVRIFDITYPDSLRILGNLSVEQVGAGNYQVNLPASRGRVLFAVEDSALQQASSITPNTASTLSAATNSADYIIISHKDFIAQANDWADYRRSQGMSVQVVNVEDIYDEFSYGATSRGAIKSFLEYAKNNWQVKPNYVLLIGDGTYDPRNYRGAGAFNFIPVIMVETIYLETGSDEALADFNDDGLAELNIGRIPAHTASDVTLALNKTSTFEQMLPTQGFSRGFLFASDLPIGYNFERVSNKLSNQLPAGTNSVQINKADTDAQSRLLSEMSSGKFLVNYTGHGNTLAWSSSPVLFESANIPNINNGSNLSIFTMLTCLNGYFIQPLDSMAETLLKKPTGGAVAVWASSGETTPDIQEIMATRFFSQVGGNNSMRLGDLINDAKTVIPGGRDVLLSWVLLGDPALKVR